MFEGFDFGIRCSVQPEARRLQLVACGPDAAGRDFATAVACFLTGIVLKVGRLLMPNFYSANFRAYSNN